MSPSRSVPKGKKRNKWLKFGGDPDHHADRVEDTAHFLLNCPLYYVQRLALRNTVSRFIHVRLETPF